MTGHGGDPGELLAHDGVTEVWRVGPTVRRPCRPFTATVQEFLRHLRSQGFDFVPEPLGYDNEGREVLSFVEGDIPTDPLPDAVWAEEVLVALAGLIRRLHDAAAGWLPPGNGVFRSGLPAAVIGFDLARPTSRVADCVNAMYWWVPLLDPADRRPAARDLDAGRRLRIFADAYGMSAAQRAEVVAVACQRARNSGVTMAAAAAADPIFDRWWTGGLPERTARGERWITDHADDLGAALA